MGQLSTHVLDTAQGRPAAHLRVSLYRREPAGLQLLKTLSLNADGRADGPLLQGEAFQAGRYRLVFDAASYFAASGLDLPDPPFLDEVPIDFAVADASQHYHVPLLLSPWSYATYRGS